jgi:DNA replication protein DnaC
MAHTTNHASSKPETISPEKSDAVARLRVEIREREQQLRRQAGIKWLGGPVAFEEFTFERFDPALNGTHRVLQIVSDFDIRKQNLLIIGPWGVGKTHLATAKAHQIFDLGGRVRFFTKKGLSDFMWERGRHWAEELLELDMMVWDDVEDNPNTKGLLTGMKLIIDERKKMGKAGIIGITNKDMTGLGEELGGFLQDRINGFFQHLVIPPTTPSARGLLKRKGSTL